MNSIAIFKILYKNLPLERPVNIFTSPLKLQVGV